MNRKFRIIVRNEFISYFSTVTMSEPTEWDTSDEEEDGKKRLSSIIRRRKVISYIFCYDE